MEFVGSLDTSSGRFLVLEISFQSIIKVNNIGKVHKT